jgi:hypothetical protein
LLSTVTYLCNGGAPTLIFEHTPADGGPEDSEDGGAGEMDDSEDEEQQWVVDLNKAWARFPRKWAHLCFDGRNLHGAPDLLSHAPVEGGVRYTFLANIWLNHVPVDAERFPAEGVSHVSNLARLRVAFPARRPSRPSRSARTTRPGCGGRLWARRLQL